MPPFCPLFRNNHLQTILAHYWRRPDARSASPVERRLFRTEHDVQVLVLSQRPLWDRLQPVRGEIVLVHGLEGSGDAGYMRSLSAAALNAGFAAHRFHMRTCGGTERLCRTLYHAGLTSDLREVLRQMRAEGRAPAFLVGFSLGGNVVLKLAGELGDGAPDLIRGVCAASTPLDLAACAHRIGQSDNRLYEARFVRRMRNRLCATGRYRPAEFKGLETIVELDDRFTAPSFGFGNAANYYRTQSSLNYLEQIRIPALLIQARDDTFIPFDIFDSPVLRHNPCIQLLVTEQGGHLGFLGCRPHRFWLDEAIMNWVKTRSG
ncbi:MAG TPA: alpha/beta fold hydrolase [Candidatus Acidoferrales bacterium]|nr:alpha/beta fold hydrolase [Candidatus Acidoferrales bacterium]